VSQHTKNIVQPGLNPIEPCPSLVKKEKRRRRVFRSFRPA
jgi:hypothetical protein